MSYRSHEDWDLCWHFLSRYGCRNSACTWRHERPVSRLTWNWSRYMNSFKNIEDLPRKSGAQFYPFGRYQSFSPMSISSEVESSGTTSPGERVTVGDNGKNTETVSIKEAGQVCNRGSYVVRSSSDLPENQTDDRQNSWHPEKGLDTVFSPFAEVFIPRENVQNIWHPDKAIISVLSPFAKVFTPGESVPKASSE